MPPANRVLLLLATLALVEGCRTSPEPSGPEALTPALSVPLEDARSRPIAPAVGGATASLPTVSRTVTFDTLGPTVERQAGGELAIELRSIGRTTRHRRVPRTGPPALLCGPPFGMPRAWA